MAVSHGQRDKCTRHVAFDLCNQNGSPSHNSSQDAEFNVVICGNHILSEICKDLTLFCVDSHYRGSDAFLVISSCDYSLTL